MHDEIASADGDADSATRRKEGGGVLIAREEKGVG